MGGGLDDLLAPLLRGQADVLTATGGHGLDPSGVLPPIMRSPTAASVAGTGADWDRGAGVLPGGRAAVRNRRNGVGRVELLG